MATEDPNIMEHLREAEDLAGTAVASVIGGVGEARLCELGILHALIALVLLVRHGQLPGEDPANRGPSA